MATGFDQHFATLGITQSQFRVLLAVWEQGGSEGIAPSVLADHLLIERGTVSVLTNRMMEIGWLARRPGENRHLPAGFDRLRCACAGSGGSARGGAGRPHAVRHLPRPAPATTCESGTH
jgi:hypothetical protein